MRGRGRRREWRLPEHRLNPKPTFWPLSPSATYTNRERNQLEAKSMRLTTITMAITPMIIWS